MNNANHPRKTLRIDSHHHLWRYTQQEFGWLEGELASLRRDHLMPELLQAMQAADVTGAVAVQASQSIAETDFLLHVAEEYPQVFGVVGWLPLAADDLPATLECYLREPKLKGLRHVVQAEPAGFLDADDFNRGIRALQGTGLSYDILIQQHQLEEAIRFVDRHPTQHFVLDHIAKPLIASGELEPWAKHLRDLSQRDHVSCKLSGMVTEAAIGWSPGDLKPYLEVALEAFSPGRVMVGSDWPVLTPRCSYAEWWQLVDSWVAPLSEHERDAVLCGNAARFYKLESPAE